MNVEDATHALLLGYADAWANRIARYDQNKAYMKGYQEGIEDWEAWDSRRVGGKRSQPGWNAGRFNSGSKEQARRIAEKPVKVKGG